MVEVNLPRLARLEGAPSEDGKFVMLDLTASTGEQFGVALGSDELSMAIAFMLDLAVEAAAKHPADVPEDDEEVTALPIPVAAMGIAPGREPSEALVSMRLGILTLTFALDLPMLWEQCERLGTMTVRTKKKPKLH